MLKKFLAAALICTGIFSVNISASAERVYCGELGNSSIYIETNSIKVNNEDSQITVQVYDGDNYYGTYFFTYMQNMNDFMYTLVNENAMRRGQHLSGSMAGGLLSRAPETIKRIFAEIAEYVQ